jgi:hypothetical protein
MTPNKETFTRQPDTSVKKNGSETETSSTAKANQLGELARVFEPGFTENEINTTSGRTLDCSITYSSVRIADTKNTDYIFEASVIPTPEFGRTINLNVNNSNT